MISKFTRGKVYVFIDAANVWYAQRTLRWRISYERLLAYLKRECQLEKCFVYVGSLSWNANQRKFLDMLDAVGYIVRTKPIKVIKTKDGQLAWKANLDVELSLEAIKTAARFDTMILISGDGDFAPILDELRRQKKNVLVMSTRGHVAKELLERAKYIDLRKLRNEIELVPEVT